MEKKLIVVAILIMSMLIGFSLSAYAAVTLDWTVWGNPQAPERWERFANKFESDHSDIKLNLIVIPWDKYRDKIFTMIAGGSAPDIMLVDAYWFPGMVKEGIFEPLDTYIEEDNINYNYWSALEKTLYYKGKQYAFPLHYLPQVLYYNKSKILEAGLEDPTKLFKEGKWTWDVFLKYAKELTEDKDGDGKIDSFGMKRSHDFIIHALPFIWSNGGTMFNEDATKTNINQPETKEALRFLWDLVSKYKVSPIPEEDVAGDPFMNEQVAMRIHWGHGPGFYKDLPFRWSIVPAPKADKNSKYQVWAKGDVWTMSSNCDNKEAAWTFLKYLGSPKGNKAWFEANNFHGVAHKDLIHQDFFKEAIDNPDLDPSIYYTLLSKYARWMPISDNFHLFRDIYEEEMEKLNYKKQDFETTINNIVEKGNEVLQEK